MRWARRDLWRLTIPFAGLLLLLIFIVMIPLVADAHTGTPTVVLAGTAQPTPTVDLTVTALAKEQLTLQVQQLQHQLQNQNNWFANNSTALIAAVTALIVAIIGLYQWRGNQNAERRKEVAAQDKELRDRADAREKEKAAQEKEAKDRKEAQDRELRERAEERFQAAVTALGSENEATQVGGAILLRSFLNEEDEGIYRRYYAQIFDLAVAYLRLRRHDPDMPESLTSLSHALVIAFKESFPLARDTLKLPRHFLDASRIQLDNAHLADADLRQIWLPEASLRNAALRRADFSEAALYKADLSQAELKGVTLTKTNLYKANLISAELSKAQLLQADLRGANLTCADLTRANPEDARSLQGTDLRGTKGLTREQLLACEARGAIVDEKTLANASQPDAAPPIQSNGAQADSTTPTQASTSPASTDGSSGTATQPTTKP